MFLHGQVDGFAATQGLRICTCFIMVFLYKFVFAPLYWQMSGSMGAVSTMADERAGIPSPVQGVCTFKEGAKDHADA